MKKMVAMVLVVIMLMCMMCISASAGSTYISEITVATGQNSITSLESKGYTVLFQGMNLVTETDSAVYLGYKKGGTAITDIIVDDKKADSITVNGISYTLASSVNLNKGTEGSAIYLYFTKDTKAGSGIVFLDTLTVTADDGSLASLFNDGSSPVLDADGKLANLETGVSGSGLYLKKITSGSIKPYISKATLVSGTSRENTLLKAINSGYNCFLDKSLSKKGYTYLVYDRTADKSKALTDIFLVDDNYDTEGSVVTGEADNMKLIVSKESGTPLLDVTDSQLFSEKFTLGDWSAVYFASVPTGGAKSQMFRESEYKTLLADETECSFVPFGTSESGTAIYGIYCGVYVPSENTAVTQTEASNDVSEAEPTLMEDTTVETDSEGLTDEVIENEKTDGVTEEETEAEESATVSSVLGNGSVTAVLILAAFVVAAAALINIVRKKKEGKSDENN